MRRIGQFTALLAVCVTLAPVCAYSSDNKVPNEQSIEALEAKAEQAQPREQCFLYAELVQQMTELSVNQYQAGEVSKADGMLKRIQALAAKIHLTLARNDKRLKNAQLLLSKTAFRLTQMLHTSDFNDRPLVEQTLAKVNDAQDEAMMQVFQK
jgi:hypothetical protein